MREERLARLSHDAVDLRAEVCQPWDASRRAPHMRCTEYRDRAGGDKPLPLP